MANATDDYTRFRTIDQTNPPYQIEDIIGRKDPTYVTVVEDSATTTASGIRRSNYR